MATTSDEAILRLNMDASGFTGAVGNLKGQFSDMTGHVNSHWLHAEQGGRAFKKVLHEITDASPIMGEAIRFAINPIVGVLVGASLAFKYFTEQLKEANKEMDKMEFDAAKPISNRADTLRKADEERFKAQREYRKFEEGMRQQGADLTEERQRRVEIDALKEKFGENKAGFLEAKLHLLEQQRIEAGIMTQVHEQKSAAAERNVTDRERLSNLASLNEQLKKTEERIKELEKAAEPGKESKSKLIKLGAPGDDIVELTNVRTRRIALEDKIREKTEEQATLKETLAEHEKEAHKHLQLAGQLEKERLDTVAQLSEQKEKDADKAAKEAEKERTRLLDETQLNRDLALAKEKRTEERNKEFLPTMKELSALPNWMGDNFRLPFGDFSENSRTRKIGEEARELQAREQDARKALLYEGPESSRFREDQSRIDTLKASLRGAGVMAPETKLESIDNNIAKLLSRAEKEGLRIAPVNGK